MQRMDLLRRRTKKEKELLWAKIIFIDSLLFKKLNNI